MKDRIFAALLAVMLSGSGLAQDRHGDGAPHDAHHPTANAGLMAFHALMEPLWHAEPGKATNDRACQQADEVIVRAKAAALRPSTDHAALIRAAHALRKACDDGKEADVESVLALLHGVFHRLAGM